MQRKIKILFFAANPKSTTQLRLDEEMREIDAKIDQSDERASIEIKSSWAVRPDDLIHQLNKEKPDIVHFSGHGDSVGNLILNDEYGEPKLVSPQAIYHLFKTIKKNIKLVFLNLCYSKIQADALVNVVDTVIGMRKPVTDGAAIAFAASFYRALGYGESIEMAYQQGITSILLERLGEEDTPILMHAKDVDPGNIFLLNGSAGSISNDEIKKKDKEEILKYLNLLIAENQYIKLPSIAEGSVLPEIPLEKVYVSLKVQQVISPVELAKAQEFFHKKINEKIAALNNPPSHEVIKQFEAEILAEYPVMNALRNDYRNSQIYKNDLEATDKNIVISFTQAFKRERYLIILGAPGSGKSTLTKWIALQLACAYKEELQKGKKVNVMVPADNANAISDSNTDKTENLGPARFPVLIKITDYAREYVKSLENESKPLSLIDYICNLFSGTIENGKQVVTELFHQHRVVVLLDGMDEINSDRTAINFEIEKFIQDWIKGKGLYDILEEESEWKEPGDVGGNQIIVTSRIVGYHQAPLKKTTLTHVTIETMQPDSIKHFCDIWTRHVTVAEHGNILSGERLEDKIATDAEDLKNAIFESNKTLVFATNPLTLTLLAVVFKSDKKLPSQRVEMYERLSEILIKKWRNSGLSVQEVYYVLPDIAFYMHSQKDSISEVDLMKQSKISFAHYKGTKLEDITKEQEDTIINPFVKKLQEQVGLIAETGTGSYQFYHRSFQEFFAAISLIRKKEHVIENIISHLEDPIWREPIYLALEYTALKKKRIDFKIDVSAEDLVRGLLDANDPLKDLIPRPAFLISTALPEMESLEEETVYEIIMNLLDLYIDEKGEKPNRFLKTKIEEIIERLYNSSKKASIKELFLKVLNEQNNSRRIAAVSYLIHIKQWFNEKFENAFHKLIYIDSPHLDFPIHSALLKYYSSDSNTGTSPNLYFKKKLLTDSDLLARVSGIPCWVKLIVVLYGGIPDTGAGKMWVSMEETKCHINTKAGSEDEIYNWAVTLDTQTGENSKKLSIKPAFDPKYIFKESFFTKKILSCLINDEPPENLIDYFTQILDAETDKYKRAEALLALSTFGHEHVQKVLVNNEDALVVFLNKAKHIKLMLEENLRHFHGYYTHIKENKDQFRELFQHIEDEEDRLEMYHMVKKVSYSLGLSTFNTCYSISEKRLFETANFESQLTMETEGWTNFFSASGTDPVYNIAVLLDTAAPALKQNEVLFFKSFARLPLSCLRNFKYLFFNVKPAFAFTSFLDIDDVVGVFDGLKYIPGTMPFVKDWVLWSLKARFEKNPDLLPEAILHGFELENAVKFSALYPEFWDDGKRYDQVKESIANIQDRFLKFRAYLLFFRQTGDMTVLNKCLDQVQLINHTEQRILAATDILELPLYLFLSSSIANTVSILSKRKGLYEDAKSKLAAVPQPESRILLSCKLATLSGDNVIEKYISNILHDIELIPSPNLQYNIIAACLLIFDNELGVRDQLASLQHRLFSSASCSNVSERCPEHLMNYSSMLELYEYLDSYSIKAFESSSEDALWSKLADGTGDESHYIRLIKKGIQNNGLKLTQAAFESISKLVELEESERNNFQLTKLLSFCYLPDFYNYQVIGQWQSATNSFLRSFTSLLLAEHGTVTERIMTDIIYMLHHEDDRIRIRASIAIHGKHPSSGNALRKFCTSKIDLASLIVLNKNRLNTANPYISTKLAWSNHNILHDNEQLIFDIIKIVENKQAGYTYLENVLKSFEMVNVKVLYGLKKYFNSTNKHVKKLLLQSYLRIMYIHKFMSGLANCISEEDIQILESLKYYQFTFDEIVLTVVNAGTLFEKNENELLDYLDTKIRVKSKIDFRKAYQLSAEQFSQALVQAGSTLYANPNVYVKNANEAAVEFQKHPNLIPTLMLWAFNTLQEELNNEDHDHLASYLILLLGFVVEKSPDTYANDELIRKFDVESLLNKVIKEHLSWLVRRGAVVLLSYLNEKSEMSVGILSDGLKDVYFVQYGIDVCWRYFENIYKSQKCVQKVLANMDSKSGHLSSVSAKILSEIARSKKCSELQRKNIISDLAASLRKEISDPAMKREIFSYDENNDTLLIYKGSLEEVLYKELLTITAVY